MSLYETSFKKPPFQTYHETADLKQKSPFCWCRTAVELPWILPWILPSILPWILPSIFVHIFYPPPSGQIFHQITKFRDIFAQILTFRDIFVRSVFTQILTLRGTSKEKKCTKSLRFATYSRHIRSFCLFKSLRYAAPP